ncbi:hypothetical protein LIER_18178 [Lithospermum erythrorhizon]|uniref:Retrotransposon gag domain-containing protein n=1 Tax=Lithospermum erythrorhizon TaxID=34254 RepID=A0AAV3QD82_LITER
MPTAASRRECKTKMSFTDRLDVVPLPKGFILSQFMQFGRSGGAFIIKFGSSIQAHQDERALMDIEQGPNESLKNYQKHYKDILLNTPEVNNKVAYMAFYKGLRYGKLKKAFVLETPL